MRPSDRRFLIALFTTVLVGLSAVALFNWWLNPYAAFNRPLQPRYNDILSSDFLHGDRGRQVRWLISQAKHAEGKTLLIGTSQMLYGIGTCSYPNLQRLALLGLTDHEIVQLLNEAVPAMHKPTTFLIAQGWSGPAEALPSESWRDLLYGPATLVSAANLIASRTAQQPACAAMPYSLPAGDPFSPEALRRDKARLQAHLPEAASAQAMVNAVATSCTHFPHKLIFFNPPVFFQTPALQTQSIAAPGRCTVQYRNLSSIEGQEIKSNWYDPTHFKPVLGRKLLSSLLIGIEPEL